MITFGRTWGCLSIRTLTFTTRHKSNLAMSKQVKVAVKQGILVGQERFLPNGSKYNCFKGVPYAVAPLGELRFKSPVPLERFAVPELDCSEHGDVAHQRDPLKFEIVGSENCLHLNVYAPHSALNRKLPVMVWIHGGGFFFGDGNSEFFLPLTLMEEDVIVVTCNYRLGALGFLCLPEAEVWGNAGLKDQRLVLQWVQQNIAQFNGDPSNVTLFGESAGAASVHLHTYAKHAGKLFHRAILQSGSANMEWVFQSNPVAKAHRLAALVGCNAQDPQDIIKYLRHNELASPLAFLARTQEVLTADEKRRGLPLPFRPVIEDSRSPDRFIDQPILDAMQQRNVISMPIIMGYNSAEGIVMLINAMRKIDEYEKDLARMVPRNLPLAPEDSRVQEIAQRMRQFYLHGNPLTPKVFNEVVDLLSDYHFTIDYHKAAEWHTRLQTQSPLYFYRFDYAGKSNIYKHFFQMEHLRGASHGDEMCYIFQMEEVAMRDTTRPPVPYPNTNDALVSQRLSRMWANFARNGDPTPDSDLKSGVLSSAWPAVKRPKTDRDEFVLDYLHMGDQFVARQNPDRNRVDFWSEIYKEYTPTDYSLLSAKL